MLIIKLIRIRMLVFFSPFGGVVGQSEFETRIIKLASQKEASDPWLISII